MQRKTDKMDWLFVIVEEVLDPEGIDSAPTRNSSCHEKEANC
jgi:hypothetical protein